MYNKAILIGRIATDIELRTTPNGISVVTFRLAVDRPYQKGGERKTDFISVTAWRQQAEFVSRYFAKGRLIGADGSIQTREYTDKDGNKRTAFEVVADRVFFVESKGAAAAPAAAAADPSLAGVSYASGSAGDFEVVDNDDDLPF